MEDEIGLDHLDAAEKVLPFQPQFINQELEHVLNLNPGPNEQSSDSTAVSS